MANGNNVEGQGRNGNIEESRGAKWEFYLRFMNVPKGPYWPCKKKKRKRMKNGDKLVIFMTNIRNFQKGACAPHMIWRIYIYMRSLHFMQESWRRRKQRKKEEQKK